MLPASQRDKASLYLNLADRFGPAFPVDELCKALGVSQRVAQKIMAATQPPTNPVGDMTNGVGGPPPMPEPPMQGPPMGGPSGAPPFMDAMGIPPAGPMPGGPMMGSELPPQDLIGLVAEQLGISPEEAAVFLQNA